MKLFVHPFSSYSQKALIAFRENDVPFEYASLEDPAHAAEWQRRWPLARFPVLIDGAHVVPEATSIIEHLAVHHPGPVPLIPADAALAVEVRTLDRFFDNYVSTPQQKLVFDLIREPPRRDAQGVEEARAMLDRAYDWLESYLVGRDGWVVGDAFSLADCAAAPSLFYADWSYPMGSSRPRVKAYRERLLARPSIARLVDEARPYRKNFPGGAPDRD